MLMLMRANVCVFLLSYKQLIWFRDLYELGEGAVVGIVESNGCDLAGGLVQNMEPDMSPATLAAADGFTRVSLPRVVQTDTAGCVVHLIPLHTQYVYHRCCSCAFYSYAVMSSTRISRQDFTSMAMPSRSPLCTDTILPAHPLARLRRLPTAPSHPSQPHSAFLLTGTSPFCLAIHLSRRA
jgi:hypothetical protein